MMTITTLLYTLMGGMVLFGYSFDWYMWLMPLAIDLGVGAANGIIVGLLKSAFPNKSAEVLRGSQPSGL